MVASACKVEWYRTPSDGFWNLYLTWLSVEWVMMMMMMMMMMDTGQRKEHRREFERGKSEIFGAGSAHRYRKESRRLDLRRLRLSRRESRALGRGLWSGVGVQL